MESVDPIEQIFRLEKAGIIDPDCKSCIELFYKKILAGESFHSIHAPRHHAMKQCESGKRNHCTCDTCF